MKQYESIPGITKSCHGDEYVYCKCCKEDVSISHLKCTMLGDMRNGFTHRPRTLIKFLETGLRSVQVTKLARKISTIFRLINDELKLHAIYWNNCLAFGSENFNVMVGKIRVMGTIMDKNKQVNSSRCPCHIIHMAAEKAADKLPFNLDKLHIVIYYFLDMSSKRLHRLGSTRSCMMCNTRCKMYVHDLSLLASVWVGSWEIGTNWKHSINRSRITFCQTRCPTKYLKQNRVLKGWRHSAGHLQTKCIVCASSYCFFASSYQAVACGQCYPTSREPPYPKLETHGEGGQRATAPVRETYSHDGIKVFIMSAFGHHKPTFWDHRSWCCQGTDRVKRRGDTPRL